MHVHDQVWSESGSGVSTGVGSRTLLFTLLLTLGLNVVQVKQLGKIRTKVRPPLIKLKIGLSVMASNGDLNSVIKYV